MKQKLVIWGASGHSLVIADIIRQQKMYEIYGFLDDVNLDRKKEKFCGAIILGGRDQLKDLQQKGVKNIIFGFGDTMKKFELSSLVKKKGFYLATAIHPQAIVAGDMQIGAGTVIVGGAVLNSGSTIGENVIINTSASIDHECIIQENVHIGPGSHIGGRVVIGRGTWVGMGSIIKDRVKIGAQSVIGAGSLVLDNIPDNVLAYGMPARIIKENHSG